MDSAKLRAWWFHRQGLDGHLKKKTPAEILETVGWARSVGGVNPYLTLFSRGGFSREQMDKAAANLQIHELPSARGCTYVLPATDFALGLRLSQTFNDGGDMAAARKLGVTDEEIELLCVGVLKAMEEAEGPLDPRGIKEHVGELARSLGEEGRKKGVTTTLPLALGKLQARGQIRRVPSNGRLDQQRYDYTNWTPGPFNGVRQTDAEAYTELAKRYFGWIGPATQANFQWFTALSVRGVKAVMEPLGLVPLEPGSDFLMFPDDLEAYKAFKTPRNAQYALVAGIDSIFLHRRDVASLIDEADLKREVRGERVLQPLNGLQDLPNHAILDRGRLIGLWEFDTINNSIAYQLFVPANDDIKAVIKKMETFIQTDLGDARSFSLDSPATRAPKIACLRGLPYPPPPGPVAIRSSG